MTHGMPPAAFRNAISPQQCNTADPRRCDRLCTTALMLALKLALTRTLGSSTPSCTPWFQSIRSLRFLAAMSHSNPHFSHLPPKPCPPAPVTEDNGVPALAITLVVTPSLITLRSNLPFTLMLVLNPSIGFGFRLSVSRRVGLRAGVLWGGVCEALVPRCHMAGADAHPHWTQSGGNGGREDGGRVG